jgi:hypothetical protein
MAIRLRTSEPTVMSAGRDLVSALGELATAASRWLTLQPVAHQVPAYAERVRHASTTTLQGAASWATDTAAQARARGAAAASATRTALINVALVGALLWWLDRMLTREDE